MSTDDHQIWRIAEAKQLEEVGHAQHRIGELEKGKQPGPVSRLWLNHFWSVRDFHHYLLRHGGRYRSLLERTRWVLGGQTIGPRRRRLGWKKFLIAGILLDGAQDILVLYLTDWSNPDWVRFTFYEDIIPTSIIVFFGILWLWENRVSFMRKQQPRQMFGRRGAQ
jgi:hypothetical protein